MKGRRLEVEFFSLTVNPPTGRITHQMLFTALSINQKSIWW